MKELYYIAKNGERISRYYPTKAQAVAEAYSQSYVFRGPSIPDFQGGDTITGNFLLTGYTIEHLKGE